MTAAARRILAVLLAGMAASCAAHREVAPGPAVGPAAGAGAVCRVGPDGGPLVAERGIGGTGAPATQVADRGIGGTGIIGVITGFGSVCVGGQEVALAGSVPVRVDAAGADLSVLRAGQLVALEAGGAGGTLSARSVLVRHEVSGPVDMDVDAQTAAPGRLRVAGQDVVVTEDTWGAAQPFKAGDWVAVSGLRRPDGAIEATRIDRRLPGPVLVHGTLVQVGGQLHIGQLAVAAPPEAARLVGQEVTATGFLLGAGLQATSLEPDQLVTDPGGYFGVGVTGLLVEGFVTVSGGQVRLGRIALPAGGAFAGASGRAVVSFSRTGDRTGPGRFEPVSVARRPPGIGAPGIGAPGIGAPGRAFTPAPGARGAGGLGPDAFGPAPGARPGGRGSGGDGRQTRYGRDTGDPRQVLPGPDAAGGPPGVGGYGTGGYGMGGYGMGGYGVGPDGPGGRRGPR